MVGNRSEELNLLEDLLPILDRSGKFNSRETTHCRHSHREKLFHHIRHRNMALENVQLLRGCKITIELTENIRVILLDDLLDEKVKNYRSFLLIIDVKVIRYIDINFSSTILVLSISEMLTVMIGFLIDVNGEIRKDQKPDVIRKNLRNLMLAISEMNHCNELV